jgi:dTDP-3-amino-2,3,6-trideoxy-4-keto-D-glucose/dTDP-3-amino-3,4,6-trideoxy-alpha-D-glucose/dTDP-2,6-dideoxy-D-kanosamine transaminase
MTPIPINDPVRVYRRLKGEIDAAVAQAMGSGRWIDGAFAARFAADFSAFCGVKRCIPLASGTDALELALRAMDVGPGDEVVTAANAGGFATEACRLVGATPVWSDVRGDTLGLDPDVLGENLSGRTRLVVATHLYGILADVAGIRRALDRSGRSDVRILEDCAQAHGAARDGRRAGSFGDAAAFSFYPTKNLGAFGDAGAILTNDDALADRVARLRLHGWGERFRVTEPFGRNSRMSEIQAAVLTVKLRHLDALNAERRAIIARYAAAARPPAGIVGADDPTNVGYLAILRTPRRGAVIAAMAAAGVATDIHYPVLDCDQKTARGLPGRKGRLPASERAGDEILTLPCYPGLADGEIDRVAEVLARCC